MNTNIYVKCVWRKMLIEIKRQSLNTGRAPYTRMREIATSN
jgi:hypothetical protein